MVIVIWSLYYFLKVMTDKGPKPFFLYALLGLLLLFFVYTVFALNEGRSFTLYFRHFAAPQTVTGIIYFRKIVLSLLPIYAFYYFSKIGAIRNNDLIGYFWIFLFLVLLGALNAGMMKIGTEDEETSTNYGYRILMFLPLLSFCTKKSLKQLLVYILCMLLILAFMKRGAILTAIVVSLIMFFYMYRTPNKIINIKLLLTIAVVGAVGIYAINELLEYSDHFLKRFSDTMEGDAHGRDSFYEFFFYYFINKTTMLQFWFGQGAFTTLFIWGNYAHNDWLEIAINQGMLGVIVFLIFTLSFLAICIKKQNDIRVKSALWMLFVIFFLKTLFSMSYDQFTLYFNIVFGYCLAQTEIQNKKEQVKRLIKSILR